MIFDLSDYVFPLWQWPVRNIAFGAFLLLLGIVTVVVSIKDGNKKQVGTCVLFIVGAFFFLSSPLRTLYNGGAYLKSESQSDALVETGQIQVIVEPSEKFPGFKNDHQYGADIVINDECYFAVSANGFSEGDTVEIMYLPKSKVVLSIQHADS